MSISINPPNQINITVGQTAGLYATIASLNATGQYLSNLITASGAGAGVLTLNSLSGVLNILGTGDIYVTTQGQNIIISGGAGTVTGDYLTTINSGVLQLQITNLVSNLFSTGLNLQTQINSVNSNIYDTGSYLQLQILNTSGALQNYYLATNPSGFITGINTGIFNNIFYPLNSNPLNYVTGDVVRPSDTGIFATEQYVEIVSGFLVSLISSSSAGVGSLEGLSGIIDLVAAGNITVSTNGQSIIISGDTGSLAGRSYSDNTFATIANLFQTGLTLSNRITQVSGQTPNITNVVYTTGIQNISGRKTFLTGISILNNINITGAGFISGDLTIIGHFQATTKSFLIDHPVKKDKKLQYGVLEGPSHSVYLNGSISGSDFIEFPDYWERLVHLDSVNVSLTPIKQYQNLYVKDIESSGIYISNNLSSYINCYYQVFAERKDVPKLEVEIDNNNDSN